MSQKVKLQISSDLEDVTKISSITLEDALSNITLLQEKIFEIKRNLKFINLNDKEQEHVKHLKLLLSEMDFVRVLLSKIDIRIGDVSSVVSGLSDILDGNFSKKEEENDNISSG